MAFRLTEGSIALTVAGSGFFMTMKRVRGVLSYTHNKLQSVARATKKMFLVAGAYASASLIAYGAFEKAMRRATAVSEVTEQQFKTMSEMAEEQSIRLNLAASKTADAFYFLGSAGLEVTDQMKAYVPVATMAKAATMEMGRSAEILVDTMKGFQIGFEHTGRVTDVLTKSVISSNMTFEQLGETLSYISGVAKLSNNSLEETVTLIATMADVGIKGTRAGTTLRRSFLNLMAPMSSMRKELEKYNIQVYDATGRMKPFIQIVGEMTERLRGASEEQKNMAFKVLFGARAIAGQIAVFNKGEEALRTFNKSLVESGGAAETVARKQMRAFGERIGRLWQRTKRLARTVGDFLAPAVLRLADAAGKATDKLDAFLEAHKLDIQEWGERVAARILYVKDLLLGFGEFLLKDWRTGVKSALSLVLGEFEVFGKSLMLVMKKISIDLYNNIGVWARQAAAMKWDLYKETGTQERMMGWQRRYQAVPKEVKRQARERAEAIIRQQEIMGKYERKYPTIEVTKTWKNVANEIAATHRKVMQPIFAALPKDLKVMEKTAREKLNKTLWEIAEKYEGIRTSQARKALEESARRAASAMKAGAGVPVEQRAAGVAGFVGLKEAWSQLALSLKPKEDLERQQVDLQREANKDFKTAVQLLRNTRDGIEDLPEQLAALQGGALRLTA